MNNDFIPALLVWYQQQAAALPWRENHDPYRVWLSEIMLQQTQVATVIPYFQRFLERFPTVHDLAAADLDTVLKLWEGLGYYSRARNMHKAARAVVETYGGRFPQTAGALLDLPGIGRYTAGAIASIAFEESAPVLDGNVIRVFSRIFNIEEDVTEQTTLSRLWEIAEALVPSDNPGDYNQALMELGRTICKPRTPLCQQCPINAYCEAFQLGVQEERPIKKKKAATPHYDVTAGLIRNDEGQFLITKRPEEKLLGGLWEFPGGKQEPGETLQACLKRELWEELTIDVRVGEFFVKVRHGFTHFKITLHVFECEYLPETSDLQCHDCADWRWVSPSKLRQYAFGNADRQVIAELETRSNMLF